MKVKVTLKHEYKLAELTGSEKQIAWAEDLRKAYIAEWEKRGLLEEEVNRDYIASIINTQTQAKWWINYRFEAVSIFDHPQMFPQMFEQGAA